MTRGKMIKELKKMGIRRINGKRFIEVKTFEITNCYYDLIFKK
ncbi:MAG: hypothetical protein SPK43_01390 [Candidatus Onthovivens sp.]|nr:hypothetical protein [Candidatus Onthovivens sp.]